MTSTADAQNNSSVQSSSEDEHIWFIFPDREPSEFSGEWVADVSGRSGSSLPDGRAFSEVGIDPSIVADKFTDFIIKLGPILNSASSIGGDDTEEYGIDQIELSVSITAEGRVGIITTATVGGHAGIRLVFRRR